MPISTNAKRALLALLLAASGARAVPAQGPNPGVAGLLADPRFQQARAFIKTDHDRFVRELITLTEIPAPPFKEEVRARAYRDMLEAHGLTNVEIDKEGNVMGVRKGSGGGTMLAVLAHLDTVFPEGTDVKVRREGTRLLAPGVGDDTRGLALMLSVIRAMNAAKFTTADDILFVGNVGEEGEGDLRGVKYLLRSGKYKDRIRKFLAIDGGEQGGITRGGVGSKRYRVTFKGPGGHSYGAFGLVNPAYAMAATMARFADLQVPSSPKTTFNVGVVRGGTSVNSIPSEVSMDVDIRSESCAELEKVDHAFLAIVKASVADENRARSTREGSIQADPKVIGERPCGETAMDAPILKTTVAVVQAFGLKPSFGISSTDSNIPMSMGIPALTIGRGGPGGRSHSPDEWVDVEAEGVAKSVEVALAIVLGVAGL
jgi:acetylornithine deacetylase/succinyl-diaminopimelate desuccinylase-like protein